MSNRLLTTVRILDQECGNDGRIHLPRARWQMGTLCGWTDVDHEELDADEFPPTCQSCLAIVEYCRELVIPRKEQR